MNNVTLLSIDFIQKNTFTRLSNIKINVYDFHIIMYFHLAQIMRNKPNFQGCKMM
jgi:hypothetical protein